MKSVEEKDHEAVCVEHKQKDGMVEAEASQGRHPGRTTCKAWMLRMEEGCLYRKERLWVSDTQELLRRIMESEHCTKVAGHMGQYKTIELIRRNLKVVKDGQTDHRLCLKLS